MNLLCPISQTILFPANKEMIAKVNEIIKRRKIYCGNKRLTKPIRAAWVEPDWHRIYPVVDGIAMLLKDSALNISDRQVFDAFNLK